MRAALIISVLTVYYSALVNADLRIQYRAINNDQQSPYHAVLIKQGLVRIDPPGASAQSVMIDLSNGDIVQLHPQSRRYFKINAHTLGQYAGFYQQNRSMLQGLIDQGLSYLDDSRRSQVEELINQYNKGSHALKDLDLRVQNRSSRVLGAECEMFGVYNKARLQRELCISNYQQLELSSQDIGSLEQLKKFVSQFGQSLPSGQKQTIDLLTKTLATLNGLPLRIVNYTPGGQVSGIIEASAISFRTIPQQAFRIPENYQQQGTPVL